YYRPGSMLSRVTVRARIVPFETIVNVCGATDIVAQWFALTPEDVDKSGANSSHADTFVHRSRRQTFRRSHRKISFSIWRSEDPGRWKVYRRRRIWRPTSPVLRSSSRQPSPVDHSLSLVGKRSGRPSRSSPKASEGWMNKGHEGGPTSL